MLINGIFLLLSIVHLNVKIQPSHSNLMVFVSGITAFLNQAAFKRICFGVALINESIDHRVTSCAHNCLTNASTNTCHQICKGSTL